MRIMESFKFGLRLLKGKETLLGIFLLAFAFGTIFKTVHIFHALYQEMSAPADIICQIAAVDETMSDKLAAIDGINRWTAYQETVITVSYDEYSQNIALCSMEAEYLAECYGDYLAVPLTGAMPYVLIESSVLSDMKNNQKEKLDAAGRDFLLQNLRFGSEVTREGRICGIISGSSENTGTTGQNGYNHRAFTTPESYKMLMGNAQTPEINQMFLMQTQNSYQLSRITEALSRLGFQVQLNGTDEARVQKWEQDQAEGLKYLYIGTVTLLCGILICYYQGRLWRKRHEDLVRYINVCDSSKKSIRRIYHGRRLWLLIFGSTGGGIIYLIEKLF